VFLEINTVCHRLSLTEFDEFKTQGDDHLFQNSPKQLMNWISKLRGLKIHNIRNGMFNIIDIIEKMVSPIPNDRLVIGTACSSLYLLNEPAYFGDCCARPRYQTLMEDYKSLSSCYVAVQGRHANILIEETFMDMKTKILKFQDRLQ